jgi:hypothetical protein
MKADQRALLGLAMALVSAVVAGQGPPLGSEFLVNTYTTGRQTYPTVASAGEGSFVVSWAHGPASPGIFARTFDSQGIPTGPEFQLDSVIPGYSGPLQHESIAADASGDFVVAWDQYNLDGASYSIHAQASSSSGWKSGAEVGLRYQTHPEVAADGDGDFVVVSTSNHRDLNYHINDFNTLPLIGQRFDASGTSVGPEFPIGDSTLSVAYPLAYLDYPESRAVGMAPRGEFVVVWNIVNTAHVVGGRPAAGKNLGMVGQRFRKTGEKLGPQITLASGSTLPDDPAVAFDPLGNFVVVWSSNGQDGNARGIRGQRFDSSGEKVGPELQVNTYTTGSQMTPSVAVDERGDFLVVWASDTQDGSSFGVFGVLFDRHGKRRGTEFELNTFTSGVQDQPRVASDGQGFVVVWESADEDGSGLGIFGRRQSLRAQSLAVDAAWASASGMSSDRNGVLEPGETVFVEPAWRNTTAAAIGLTGAATAPHCAIGSGCISPFDAAADYGTIPADGIADCNHGADGCYRVSASGPRPGTHWDGQFFENLSAGGSQLWMMHVGDSFTDVPRTQPFYKKIEALLHNGITSGCTATAYCPGTSVTRDAMAIFVAKGLVGGGEFVPATGLVGASAYDCSSGGVSLFTDVLPTDSFCRHVHYLAAKDVTLGCTGTQYCPGQTITRDAMASFVAKAIVAPGGGAAVPATYSDAGSGLSYSCAAASPNVHFTDVPAANPFCKHIHYLWAKGIVDGCSATTYCPSQPVARDAMAKFLANAFNLRLYGP